MNRTILYLSLVLSIIYLIYLVIDYIGLIRYYQLHFYSTEHYLSSYKNKPRYDDSRVVIAFTATEEELKNIKPFLNSILDQSYRVDDIALTIPYKNMDKVPNQYKSLLSSYGFSKDYKDSNNLIYSVLREPESDTRIILVEPNIIYGQDFVQSLLDKSKDNKNSIIYGRSDKDEKWGILIKPKFFNTKVCEYDDKSKCADWVEKCSDNNCKILGYNGNFKRSSLL